MSDAVLHTDNLTLPTMVSRAPGKHLNCSMTSRCDPTLTLPASV
jgi:hypothetical protein